MSVKLTETLSDQWDVHASFNSSTTIDIMKYLEPDAMILDLNLSPQNGIDVLRERFPNVPPVILALTNYTSPYVEQTAASLGVGFIARIPCKPTYIRDQLEDMMAAYLDPPTRLSRHLHLLGINVGWDGYRYLMTAIPLYAEDPGQQLTKELYYTVAKECNASSIASVERSIRIAIHAAWEKRDADLWAHYFPDDSFPPTNKEFIATLAEQA